MDILYSIGPDVHKNTIGHCVKDASGLVHPHLRTGSVVVGAVNRRATAPPGPRISRQHSNSSIDRNPCCRLRARHFLDEVAMDVIKP